MPEWDRERWTDDYGQEHGRTNGLRLDDGTYLSNYDTTLRNEHGEETMFEVIADDTKMKWYGWGPHSMTVVLRKTTIQSMYDAGDLTVIGE